MPLLDPLNDRGCLHKLHQSVTDYMQTDQARSLASQFGTVYELIEFIRHLDQRDDMGDPRDGPRLTCDVTQRLRLPALDPNCFERLALFLALALLIDPNLELTSATMMLDNGLHSFPVRIDGDKPQVVVLDPMTSPSLNTMTATAYELRNASPLAESDIGPWFSEVARNACVEHGAEECYDMAMDAIRTSLLTGQPIRNASAIDCVLELTHQDAQLFGAKGRTAFDRVERSLRNLSIKLDTKRVGRFLNGLMETAEPLAAKAIKTALIAKFGPAAAIALQGVNLGTAEVESGKPQSNIDSDDVRAALALIQAAESANDNDTNDTSTTTNHNTTNKKGNDKHKPLTREGKRQRMRRMSLAFRPKKNKEQ